MNTQLQEMRQIIESLRSRGTSCRSAAELTDLLGYVGRLSRGHSAPKWWAALTVGTLYDSIDPFLSEQDRETYKRLAGCFAGAARDAIEDGRRLSA